jgi:ATP-binding cassette subfamily B protein/subfamily B ATP-binding cassette protein MsbA
MNTCYRRLLPYAVKEWRPLALISVLTIVGSVLTALQPWPLKLLVDYALKGVPAPETLKYLLSSLGLPMSPAVLVLASVFASIALFGINCVLDGALTVLWAVAGQRMVFALTCDLFHALQRLSLSYHSRRTIGDSLTRLTVDTWSVYHLAESALISPLQQVAVLMASGSVAFRLDHQLALISLAIAPLLGVSSHYFGNRLKQRARSTRQAQSRLTAFVHQVLSSIIVVQCFGMEAPNRRRFEDLSSDVIGSSQRSTLVNSAYGIANGLITTAGMGVILFAGARRVLGGQLSLGSLLIFVAYIKSMHEASQGLLQMFGSLKPVQASLDRIVEVLDAQERVLDSPHAKILAPGSGEEALIRFERVSFGYEVDRPVLQDIDFEARPGEVVALVGATGAGKSTLVSLIPRFFDPWVGRITLNGVNIRDIRLACLREKVSLVLQEPFLLPLTIAENIAYGRPQATRAEIIAAADAANADEFIRRLPQGYDTEIGEWGATLSGGQRQRIAIARALLKAAPILILDEPTSALDARTESLILQALDTLVSGRTTFIIAHRLSTIRRADRILLLNQGAIVESGTHDELLALGGLYYRLHALQFGEAPAKVSV